MKEIIKSKKYIIVWISLLSVYSLFLIQSQDSDMFWLISNGREILKNGFLYENPATIIQTSLINQQWLYCVLIALVDKLGYFGHISFVLIQNILLVSLSTYFINKKIQNKKISAIIAMIILVLSFPYMINIRPQCITTCLLLLHIILLDKSIEEPLFLLFLPIVIILEANLHGSVVLYHIFISLPFIIQNKRINWLILFSTICILPLSVINPYGLHGTLYVFKAFLDNSFGYVSINELKTLSIFSIYSIPTVISIVAVTYLAYKKKTNSYILFYSISIILLSLFRVKHLALCTIPLVYLLPELYILFKEKIKLSLVLKGGGLLFLWSSLVLTIVLLTETIDKRNIVSATTPITLAQQIPDKNANVYTEFNNGGYLQYMGFDHIFIDARPEIYINNDLLKNYSILSYGKNPITKQYYKLEELEKILDSYNFKYILCDKTSMINRICELNNKYQFIDTDGYTNLYIVN